MRDHVLAALAMALGAAALGFLLLVLLGLTICEFEMDLLTKPVCLFPYMLIIGGVQGLAIVAPAIGALWLLSRIGFDGWLAALCVGGAFGFLGGAVVSGTIRTPDLPWFTLAGATFGLIFWVALLALRRRRET